MQLRLQHKRPYLTLVRCFLETRRDDSSSSTFLLLVEGEPSVEIGGGRLDVLTIDMKNSDKIQSAIVCHVRHIKLKFRDMDEPHWKRLQLSLERPYKDDDGQPIPVLLDITPEGRHIYEPYVNRTFVAVPNLDIVGRTIHPRI